MGKSIYFTWYDQRLFELIKSPVEYKMANRFYSKIERN